MQFCISVLPGSAEALFRWGGKIKHHLISYFLSNISTKNYQNLNAHESYSASKLSSFLTHPADFGKYVD